jgi:hypothetical protein
MHKKRAITAGVLHPHMKQIKESAQYYIDVSSPEQHHSPAV